MSLIFPMADPAQRVAGLAAAAAALRRGELVGLPLDSGYALVADAFSAAGVSSLRRARGRDDLRPQVVVGKLRAVAGVVTVAPAARELMVDHWPGLLTLLLASHPSLAWQVCPAGAQLAVRMPMHPVALELAADFGPLACVPAAPPARAALESADEVRVGLPGVARVLLDGGTVPRLADSTVVDATVDPPRIVRLGAVSVADLRATCAQISTPEPVAAPAT